MTSEKLISCAALASLLVLGCSKAGSSGGDGDGDEGGGRGGPDAGDLGGGPDAAPPPAEAAVYAHSSSELYRIDPDTLEVSLVGAFQWPSGSDTMTDIAIDEDGNMTGISYTRVYAVNKETAECTYLADLATSFNGLSWVTGASPDPNPPEILIGAAQNGDVYEIDPETGASSRVGNYGGGLGSSGDIVSVQGFGTVATVTTGSGGTDRLARVDPTTWEATLIGDTAEVDIWGLGFWEDQVYGFTDTQKFVLVDVDTGAATEVETSTVNWWGAGVTTSAPVIE